MHATTNVEEVERRWGARSDTADITVDTPAVTEARRAAHSGNTAPAERLLDSTKDVNERAYVIEAIADWKARPAFLDEWVGVRPKHSIPLLVRGIHSVVWAWEARGSRYAAHVSQSDANTFGDRLLMARQDLEEAARRNPSDGAACAWLTKVGRGLGDSELAERWFQQGHKRSPGLRVLYSLMLQNRCTKWGGSHEDMYEFARTHAAAAPARSGLQVLVAEAHFERYEAMDANDPARTSFWQKAAIELSEMNNACFHPTSGCTGMNAMRNHNWFARVLWEARLKQAAKPHFEAIGRTPNAKPWESYVWWIDWLLNPFKKARRECLRA